MTPAPGAGGEERPKKSRRRRPRRKSSASTSSSTSRPTSRPTSRKSGSKSHHARTRYAKRVDEVSAGGLVVDSSGTKGLLIARRDLKDQTRLIWSLPKGHIEEGETPEIAAIREVAEETGITSEISLARSHRLLVHGKRKTDP